jgi:biopolymer transport protein ExbD
MPIKFRCPKCTQAYSISSKKAGTKINCQKCGAKMRIPSLEPTDDAGDSEAGAGQPQESPALTPELKNAFDNLFDDDEFDDDEQGVEFEQATAGSEKSVAEDEPDAVAADDVDAVLEFEKQLEDDGHEPAAPAPVYVPDELFAGDDEEEEEDNFFGSSSRVDDEEMDLTPMVDVTFLLLIFFMITASFSIQKTLEVPAPDPDEEGASTSISIQEMEETSVTVHIDSRNVMYVDDEPVADPTRLPDMLRASRMNEVLITSHENALHEMVVKAIDAANEVQMQKIRLGITRGAE